MTDDNEDTGRRLIASRMPMNPAIARDYELNAGQWRVLVEAIWPNAKTPEAILMALSYCRARNLDPFKKPVHIVPMWSTAAGKEIETVWPGIAELRTTATRTRQYAGIDPPEWGPMVTRTFTGLVTFWEDRQKKEREETVSLEFPEWVRRTVYRKVEGVENPVPFTAEVYWEEAYATLGFNNLLPNAMWRRRRRGQLDKVGEASALRMAFPEEIGGDYAAEEMEGHILHDAVAEDPAGILTPTAPQKQPQGGRSPARPTGGPPSAPKALPAPSADDKPLNTTVPTEADKDAAFLRGDDATFETARQEHVDQRPIPPTRPGATRGGQQTVSQAPAPDGETIIAEATNRFSAIEDGDADGWFNVWKDYTQYEATMLAIDWADLTDLAQRHYDRTHDDGGKVADSGEVNKG